jgi:hypothetical protein
MERAQPEAIQEVLGPNVGSSAGAVDFLDSHARSEGSQ